jgi:predicted transglutaminase-like cysteine proteinase
MALVLTSLASAPALASGSLRFGPAVSAPFGFIELCVREPRVCRPAKPRRVPVLPSGAVTAEDGRFAELRSVDRAVNHTIRPRADPAVKGFADRWMLGVSVGDCEEYALAKRERLIDRGWPSTALLIAVGRLPDGRQHAVLLARVGREVWVLDNRRSGPTRFQNTAMEWLAVQSPERPDRWRRL